MQHPYPPSKPYEASFEPQMFVNRINVINRIQLFDESDIDFSLIDTTKKWRFVCLYSKEEGEAYYLEQYEEVVDININYEVQKRRYDEAMASYQKEMAEYNVKYEEWVKFTQQKHEAKERAEYERLKEKYGQKL